MSEEVHRVYLIPGMFGFGRLAGYDYFEHVERLLAKRFQAAGVRYLLEIVPTPPTASIRRRAHRVADQVSRTAGDGDGPIHLVGHSTGGLDARLIASPTVCLELDQPRLAWKSRLRSVVTINTPHHGTPLAGFFTTVSGTRLLYALSLLTFTTLRFGGPPLTIFSSLIAAIGTVDELVGVDIKLLDRTTNLLLRFVGDRGRDEVRDWLDGIRRDQGGIIQITPEAMDIFNAATENAEGVRYGSLASASPPPTPVRLVTRVRSPYQALSATIYTTLHSVTSRANKVYPCPDADEATRKVLHRGIGRTVDNSVTDGIVPTLSMLWGELLWTGRADHLDVVGHFHDDRGGDHVDWLASGSHFDRTSFAAAMDALGSFLLRAD
ncbi:MAG: hypothetical protein JRH11_02080 [Deltaproteobacteria bacterium]|nr:hypothetical protein [Deltaproteobacteria bacterium]